eukprot:scaffold3186_cov125-Isochrysis_galbana.AAC.6
MPALAHSSPNWGHCRRCQPLVLARPTADEVYDGVHGDMRLAVASSADTPRAVEIGKAAMRILEVGATRRPRCRHFDPILSTPTRLVSRACGAPVGAAPCRIRAGLLSRCLTCGPSAVVPGVSFHDVLMRGWGAGTSAHLQIGRSPPLSADKSKTHFPILHEQTGAPHIEKKEGALEGRTAHPPRAGGCIAESEEGPLRGATPAGTQIMCLTM